MPNIPIPSVPNLSKITTGAAGAVGGWTKEQLQKAIDHYNTTGGAAGVLPTIQANMAASGLFGGGGNGSPDMTGYAALASPPSGSSTGGAAPASGSTPDTNAVIAALLAGSGGGGGSGDTPSQTENAATNRMMAEAQIADLMFQRTIAEANVALSQGNLELARQKFADSQIWSKRAADAQDQQNRLTGIGHQITAQSAIGNLNLGALNAQTNAYGTSGGLVNQATGLNLSGLNDAGNIQNQGYQTQITGLNDAGNLGVNNFSAIEQALSQRGNLTARGAENYSNLTNILGNLAVAQQKLGLDIATTPRNAIAGFLMGRGQSGQGAEMFNPANILGINPAQIQQVIQSALGAASQVGVLPAMEKFDASGMISGLQGAGNNAAAAGVANAAGIRGVANGAQGAVAPDVGALRQVGASAPGAIQGAVSGLSNAAASVVQAAPGVVPGDANSANPYSALMNQMVAGGAPQIATDQLRSTAAAAGYTV